MRKPLTFLPSIALVAMLALPAAAEPPDADTVVARVNGEEIRLGHLIVARAALPEQYQQLPPDVLFDALLEQLIQQSALKQALTRAVPKRVEMSLDNERRSLLAAETIEDILAGTGSEEQIRAAYDARFAQGSGGDEYNAAHILVETQEAAEAVKAELDGGADFAETAKARSTGPSGPNGGALGWFGDGQMVPEFEAAVKALEPGQVSGPVQTQFGWHIVILNDRRKQEAPALDAVRDDLLTEIRRAAVDAKVAELTAAASVERIDAEGLTPDLLLNMDLVGN